MLIRQEETENDENVPYLLPELYQESAIRKDVKGTVPAVYLATGNYAVSKHMT
jgi:hypothetical protein